MTRVGPGARGWAVGAALVLTLVAAGGLPATGPAAAADRLVDAMWLDASYGEDGVAPVGGVVTGAGAVDADGRAYVVTASPAAVLHRLTADGTVDSGFAGGSLILPFATHEAVVHPDPGGTVTVLRPADHGVVVLRYTGAGLPDAGFNGVGAVRLLADVALAWPVQVVDRDGGILLLASARDGDASYLVALTDAGTLDPGWAAAGPTPGILPVPEGIDAIAADGTTVVAVRGRWLVRYAADGTPDTTFRPVRAPVASTGVTVRDGAYYVSGPSGVRRVLASGRIDEAFAAERPCDPVFAGELMYLACDGAVTRYTRTGELDAGYGDGGHLVVDGALLGVQPTGRPLVALAGAAGAVARLRTTARGTPVAGAFVPLPGERLLDTRDGTGTSAGPVPPGGHLDLAVAGRGGVPGSGAAAVVLTVTVVDPAADGFVTVYPAGGRQPQTSNVTFAAGRTTANLVTVPLGADGSVALRNGSSGPAELVADVAGYYRAGTAVEPGAFVPVPPARLLDTRLLDTGPESGPVRAGADVALAVAGRGAVPPAGAGAVVLTVTVTEATTDGVISVARPVLSFTAGRTVSTLVTAALAADGTVSLHNGSSGPVQLVVDLAGYYLSGVAAEPGTFVPLDGAEAMSAAVPALGTTALVVGGRHGVPTTASAALLEATVTGPGADGFLTVYPGDTPPPAVASLTFAAGRTVRVLAVSALGADGSVGLRNGSPGAAEVAVRVAGYFV